MARKSELHAETEILRASRTKPAFLILFAGGFTVGGGAMVAQGDATGWFVLSAFALITLLEIVLLMRPGQLSLSQEGMTMTYLGRRGPMRAWSQCSNFGTWYQRGVARVTFDYDRPAPFAETRTAYVLNTLAGGNVLLPDTYGMKAEALADLLRQRAEAARNPAETRGH